MSNYKGVFIMDFGTVSSALNVVNSYNSTQSVAYAASVMMLDKTMEANESMNIQMVRMMEQSVNPHIGGNIDIFA